MSEEPINKDLIQYRLDELKTMFSGLKSDISDLSLEVKNLSGSGCQKGKAQDIEIQLIKVELAELKERPKKTIAFISIIFSLILTIIGILFYLHNSLPNTNNTSSTITTSSSATNPKGP